MAMEAACRYFARYGALAETLAQSPDYDAAELLEIGRICKKLAIAPPDTFHEALQSAWMLLVLLQMESNASSFSPGRMDQYLYPYYQRDKGAGRLDDAKALELIEGLFIKFNHIVYLRSSGSAKYFAGFPIGFNVAIGGQNSDGQDASPHRLAQIRFPSGFQAG